MDGSDEKRLSEESNGDGVQPTTSIEYVSVVKPTQSIQLIDELADWSRVINLYQQYLFEQLMITGSGVALPEVTYSGIDYSQMRGEYTGGRNYRSAVEHLSKVYNTDEDLIEWVLEDLSQTSSYSWQTLYNDTLRRIGPLHEMLIEVVHQGYRMYVEECNKLGVPIIQDRRGECDSILRVSGKTERQYNKLKGWRSRRGTK